MYITRLVCLLSLLSSPAFGMKHKKKKRKEKRQTTITLRRKKKKKTKEETPQQKIYETSLPQMLVLHNTTPWELEIFYTYAKDPDTYLHSIVVPGDKLILQTPKSLDTITPLVTSSLLPTAKNLESSDLKNMLESESNLVGPHFLVTMTIPEDYGSLEELKRFTYTAKNMSKADCISALSGSRNELIDAFPTVKHLIGKKKIPFAKDFLGLAEPNELASEHPSLEDAYKRLLLYWKNLENIDEKSDILESLKLAYETYSNQTTLSTDTAAAELMKNGCAFSLKDAFGKDSELTIEKALNKAQQKLQPYKGTSAGELMLRCLKNEYQLITLFKDGNTVIRLSK